MKGTLILLDHLGPWRVAARLVDGRLDDLLVDSPDTPPGPGAIARGRVARAAKGMGGVFVTLPEGTGFLRGASGLAEGQTLLVQVSGTAEPGKALPLTTRLLFKSRHAIVTPGAAGLNLSRRIQQDETRARLKSLAEELMEGAEAGLILRSAAADADEAEVAEDIAEMRSLCETLLAETAGPPEWLLDGPDAHALAWRDWTGPAQVETAPGCLEPVLDQIAALGLAEEPLTGGGFMAIEPTRALVAVDVNTGPDTSPAAALKANLAAVRGLPRALRLRGLGGQIVIDFAPLPKRDRRQIEQALAVALRTDSVETSVLGWTPLGHLELSRKRERPPLPADVIRRAG